MNLALNLAAALLKLSVALRDSDSADHYDVLQSLPVMADSDAAGAQAGDYLAVVQLPKNSKWALSLRGSSAAAHQLQLKLLDSPRQKFEDDRLNFARIVTVIQAKLFWSNLNIVKIDNADDLSKFSF